MWTDANVAILKKLWLEGNSASQIAAALGGFSRNAVIGKSHRLALNRASAPRKTFSQQVFKPAAAKISPSLEARARRSDAGAAPKPRMPRLLPRMEAPALAAMCEPGQPAICDGLAGVVLLDLTNETCRWPIGDPLADSFRYCGALEADLNAGKPYCPACAKRAFKSGPAPTKRMRAR